MSANRDYGANIRMLGSNVITDKDGKQISLNADERNAAANAVTDTAATPIGEDNPFVSEAYVNEKISNMKLKGTHVEIVATLDAETPSTITHGLDTSAIIVNVWDGVRMLEVDIEKDPADENNKFTITANDAYTNLQVLVIGLDTETGTPVTPPSPQAPTYVAAVTDVGTNKEITVTFDKPMAADTAPDGFTVTGTTHGGINLGAISVNGTTMVITLTNAIQNDEVVAVVYTAGTTVAADGGVLASNGPGGVVVTETPTA